MNRLVALCGCAIMTCVLAAGCGGGTQDPSKLKPEDTQMGQMSNPDTAVAKSRLEQIAQNGNNAPSNLYGIDKGIDATGKPELKALFQKLGRAKKPEEVKQLAAELASKL